MSAGNEAVTIQIGAAQVTVPKDAAVRAFLAQVLNGASPITPLSGVPRIGQSWTEQGGIYAGVVRGDDGAPDYHLIVAETTEGAMKWDAAMKWATGLKLHGFADFSLPKRKEQAVLYGNVPELFEKAWYWSCEQRAESSDGAWYQGFTYGYQGYYGKDCDGRVRAVRRIVIQ